MAVVEVFCRVGSSHATVRFNGREYPALIGRGGPIAAHDKHEGDGYTPLGRYPLLQGFYRADRGVPPNHVFPWQVIEKGDSWNDDPASNAYNQLVQEDPDTIGEAGLWKTGPQHDVSIFVGYNVDPIVPEKGSGIFIHAIRPGSRETAGCIALSPEHVREIAAQLHPGDEIDILMV
jgi:L,D-peptidoglycan transpeptidase YkuD (ErfK/YbiS/YcfS/YnhG family)